MNIVFNLEKDGAHRCSLSLSPANTHAPQNVFSIDTMCSLTRLAQKRCSQMLSPANKYAQSGGCGSNVYMHPTHPSLTYVSCCLSIACVCVCVCMCVFQLSSSFSLAVK